ncbi:MAG: hypothetical protein M1360_00485 [Candidatus Marsarchaeota archaeon]|jgi:hypothetical protein|nr:hypothetical protein [Candidatus Marsarchaeota archaeon]MCL5418402.1 hypothetical protein [Candidatus Marsarchaeota archaeon]
MRKKVVYAGLILLVLSIALLYVSNAEAQNAIKGYGSTSNVTVKNDSFSVIPINRASTANAITAIFVYANNALNEYVFNASTFSQWKSAMLGNSSASGIHYAKLFDKGNTSIIYSNNAIVSLILPQNVSSRYSYLVIDNTPGSNSSSIDVPARIMVLATPESALIPFAGGDIAGVIILLSGIIVIIYGLLRKPKVYAQPEGGAGGAANASSESAYIDSLYKSIESNKRKSKKNKNG